MIATTLPALPAKVETILAQERDPETLFKAVLPLVCELLKADRCFLEVRQPSKRLYRDFCWRRSPKFPDFSTDRWQLEPSWELEDPLFAAALQGTPDIFVEDVETAGPTVVNLEFEREHFGHRALIHAHIYQDDLLYGVLQPCVFGHPRRWSELDRWIIKQMSDRLKPFVVRFAETAKLESQ